MMNPEPRETRISERTLRWVSIVLGVCALAFQVFVLYPWHLEISEQIKALSKR